MRAGAWFNIEMSSYQYRKFHCGDKTILRSSYLHNGIPYTGKMTSLYGTAPGSLFRQGNTESWFDETSGTGFPQLLKNHWNSGLFQDHGKIFEFHEKFLEFIKIKESWKNHWIFYQLLMEKSLNSEIDVVLTNYMGK